MSAVEKLFVQIFEKKKAIIEQVRRQTELFDQHLATKLLIDGIAPPPWLWNPRLHSQTSNPDELKKEDLISGLLFPLPQPAIPYSSSFCSLYNKPVGAADNGVVPDSLLAEGCASKKDIGSRDGPPVLSMCPINDDGCASSGVPEHDASVSSPEDPRDMRISGIYQEQSQSLLKIQRSKSRQKALEIRNSAKAAKSRLCMGSGPGLEITGSGIASLRPDHANETESVKPVDINGESYAVEELKVGDELESVEPVDINTKCCALEEVKVSDSHFKERDSNIFSGTITTFALVDSESCMQNAGENKRNSAENYISRNKRSRASFIIDGVPKAVNSNISDQRVTQSRFATSGKSKTAQATQMLEEKSLLNHNDLEFFKVNADQLDKELIDYADGDASSDTRANIEGITNPMNSETLGCSVPRSISTSNMAPLEKPMYRSEEVDLKIVSGSQVSIQPCADTSAIVDMEGSAAMAPDTDLSDAPVDAPSVRSGSNLDRAGLRVGLEVLASRSPSDIMFMKPKQLDFENMEYCSLNEPSSPALENKLWGGSSETRPLNLSGPADLLDKLTSVNCQAKRNSSQGIPLLEDHVGLSHEEEAWGGSSEARGHGTEELDAAIVAKLELDDGKLGTDACGGLKLPTDDVLAEINEYGVSRNPDVLFPSIAVDFPSAIKADETNGNSMQQNLSSDISEYQHVESYLTRSCFSNDKNVGTSKSSEHLIVKKHIHQRRSFGFGMEDLWPQHKRRKIEGQIISALSASPCLRVKPPQSIQENLINNNFTSAEDNLDDVLKFQPVPVSCDENVMQPNVNEGPVGEMHQNVLQHTIEVFESSPKQQVEQGEFNMGERDRSTTTPSTSIDDHLLLPSWTKLGTGDCQGKEKVGEVGPINDNFDTKEQCVLEDNQDSLHVDNVLEFRNIEHFTCTDIPTEQRKSHLGGNVEFSSCSVDSPHNESMALIDADPVMPVLEGFIMQTDSGKSCVTEDVIHLEKMDLPNIERGSLLEQLCRSTSMSTPLCHFPTTYKLHGTPNLNQSVPNGLLECMDLRSTLSICNDTKANFRSLKEEGNHGKSYPDCLPFPVSYSAWDVKKPFASPVGKLWDRISSYSSSSEKQWSLNPELPCINEENEDTDEVADKFEEGINSEVMTVSAKREPLANITQYTNIAASVSEAELCAARGSMDSINTEVGFSGTHKKVKQKSSKRRYTNKAKENQSISLLENGVKGIRESFRNRFSKPKLSGKTSMREGGPSFSGKDFKCNNIVSNITSFVPLVQQKQAAPVCTGKRDVKVRALEAAEAAKRLAEKKENERKMKKEALKLERVRLEQENMRQMEILKKKKEEERKQKEANMAAKKRQGEEEERKDKVKRRKRVEEAWKQKRGAGKQLKKMKCQAADERAHERKKTNDEIGTDTNMEEERGDDNLEKLSKDVAGTMASSSDAKKACILHEDDVASSYCGDNAKATSFSPNKTASNLATNPSREPSYEISPYKCSDDEEEEEEEDQRPNTKFIPSWSSKKLLELAVSSQQRLDPTLIFPRDSFCIAEVVIPRKC